MWCLLSGCRPYCIVEKITPSTVRSLLVLFVLALLLQIVEVYYWELFPPEPLLSSMEIQAIERKWAQEDSLKEQRFVRALKPFDPNLIDSVFLSSLGLDIHLQANWLNYLRSGAHFRNKEDLLRLYSMDSSLYQRLYPYLQIANSSIISKSSDLENESPLVLKPDSFNPNLVSRNEMETMGFPKNFQNGLIGFREKYRPFKRSQDLYLIYGMDSGIVSQLIPWIILDTTGNPDESLFVDLNQADSTELIKINGIGSVKAQRIIEWRNRLGGFHSLQQLEDHHIIDSITLLGIKDNLRLGVFIRNLSLNESSLEDLQSHPYINYYLALSIVQFRERFRQFKSIDELANIELVDDVLFSKLAPYFKEAVLDSL